MKKINILENYTFIQNFIKIDFVDFENLEKITLN